MFNRCKHKYGKVDTDNFQYCIHCGYARYVDIGPCPHNWEIIEISKESSNITGCQIGTIYHLRCKACGEITFRRCGVSTKYSEV